MMIRLLLFAGARELVGQDQIDIPMDDEATVGDLKQLLVEQHPCLMKLVESSTISVDQEYASDEKVLYHDAEVGLIPSREWRLIAWSAHLVRPLNPTNPNTANQLINIPKTPPTAFASYSLAMLTTE